MGLFVYNKEMTFHIVTLFPEVFEDYLKESIIGKAVKKGHIKVKFYDIRKFSKDKKHHKVDDKAYGGGPGMVLMVEPIYRALKALKLKVKSEKLKVRGIKKVKSEKLKIKIRILEFIFIYL